MTAPTESMHRTRVRGWATTLVLLLAVLMCVRLCMTESLRETLTQKAERLAAASDPQHHIAPVIVGPATTLGLAALTLAITGAAGAIAVAAGVLSSARLLRWAIVAGIAALGWASVHAAANRFAALVGTADVVAILAAGWSIGMLCHPRLAGDRGRRIILAAVAAVLAAWVVQGLNYHFIDGPEATAAFEKDRIAQLQQLGIVPGSVEDILYESRMRSGELEGYMTLSNVTAAGFVGMLAVMAGLVVVTLVEEGNAVRPKGQVPAGFLFAGGGILIILVGGYALTLTQSNGGMAMGAVCVCAVIVGILLRPLVRRWRWLLTGLAIAGFVAGMAGVIGYGIARQRLPGKSLTFRWFYWSGAARMIEDHPLIGVGMDNFGSWYITDKRPDAPEDVADPHNYFVRLAAEMGIPAAALAATLILWSLLSTSAAASTISAPPRTSLAPSNVFILAAILALAWWFAVYALSWPGETYYLELVFIAAAGTAAAGAAVFLMLEKFPSATLPIALAGMVGALGMFVYDQINMALVTGGVAFLFWMLLGVADAAWTRPPARKIFAAIPAAVSAVAALALAAFAWLPTLHGTFSWDPAPAEYRYVQTVQAGDSRAAEASLDQAIALAPRSVELRSQRFALRQRLHEPVADDIRALLTIDRSNAAVRISLALPNTDLPPTERAAALEDALRLDQQLAPDEPKRLSADRINEVQAKINALKKTAG